MVSFVIRTGLFTSPQIRIINLHNVAGTQEHETGLDSERMRFLMNVPSLKSIEAAKDAAALGAMKSYERVSLWRLPRDFG